MQFLSNFQVNQANESTPTAKLVIDDPMQGETPTNVDSLSAAGRRLVLMAEDLYSLY